MSLSPAACSSLLIAQSRMGDISRYYREDGAYDWTTQLWFILIPIIAVGTAWGLFRLYNQAPSPVNTPFGMLGELCRAHGLPTSGRRLLERIAEHAELEQPASMLTASSRFDAAVEAAGEKTKLSGHDRELLCEIRRRLLRD